MFRTWLLPLVLLGITLAGCSSPGDRPDTVITVTSGGEGANVTGSLPETPKDGSIAGIVLDEAYRPIEGATVRVPGLDRRAMTDEAGRFGIASLPAGGIYLRVEHPAYHPNSAEANIVRGEIVELQILLAAVVVEPYVSLQPFSGFTDLSSDMYLGGGSFTCDACRFQVNLPPGPEAVVLEAGSGRHSTDPTGTTDDRMFTYYIYDAVGDRIDTGSGPDPLRVEWNGTDEVLQAGSFRLELFPRDLVPQANVEFDLVVATFHNGADPDAWTLLGADA